MGAHNINPTAQLINSGVTMDQLIDVACGCGNKTFEPKHIMKQMPVLLGGNGKDAHIFLELVCCKCGKPSGQYLR